MAPTAHEPLEKGTTVQREVPRICSVIRAAIQQSGYTQQAIAAVLGEKQQTISGWALCREPRLDDLERLEDALGKPRGFLLRAAGYIADTRSARDVIAADPLIAPSALPLVLAVYDAAVRTAAGSSTEGGPPRGLSTSRTTG